jgi:alkyl hydroperoxide reductase subunit AhpF
LLGPSACHNRLMGLLSSADQARLREAFAEMTHPVRLLFFTQTLDCEACPATRQILDELPPLSDKISVEELNVVIDVDKAKQYGIDRAPGIALVGQDGGGAEHDSRIRFLGAPSGYEFISLVQAVLLVGGRPSTLSDDTRKRLAMVDKPVTMQVFTTPT